MKQILGFYDPDSTTDLLLSSYLCSKCKNMFNFWRRRVSQYISCLTCWLFCCLICINCVSESSAHSNDQLLMDGTQHTHTHTPPLLSQCTVCLCVAVGKACVCVVLRFLQTMSDLDRTLLKEEMGTEPIHCKNVCVRLAVWQSPVCGSTWCSNAKLRSNLCKLIGHIIS